MSAKAIININCTAPTKIEAYEVADNFTENYWDLAGESGWNEDYFNYNNDTKEVDIQFTTEFEHLTEDKQVALLRLTHHAEALYDDTNIEYTHVDVTINGEVEP